MQQDANNTAEEVSEQDLQVATGGCRSCETVFRLATHTGMSRVQDLGQVHPLVRPVVQKNMNQLTNVAVIANETKNIAPREGQRYCANAKYVNHLFNKHSMLPN